MGARSPIGLVATVMFPGCDPAMRAGYPAEKGTSADVTRASSGPRGTVGPSGRSRCGRATEAQARINARTEPYLVAGMGPVSRAVAFILPAHGVCTLVGCIRTTSLRKLRIFMRSASDRPRQRTSAVQNGEERLPNLLQTVSLSPVSRDELMDVGDGAYAGRSAISLGCMVDACGLPISRSR